MSAELAAVKRVIDSRRYVLGPELDAFEEEFADYLGVNYVVGVSSGTDALYLILKALQMGPGDEVLVPALTFVGTAEAVVMCGATPVFCDVDPETLTVTRETVKAHLTPQSAAIIAVDLFGNPAPIDTLDFALPVIEDACQAAGSSYKQQMCGSQGIAAAFSFYPSKNLACIGDGGAIATNEAAIAEEARLLRHHGARGSIHHLPGGTHRLDEIQAAVLRVRLRCFDPEGRGNISTDQRPTEGSVPAYHQAVIRSLAQPAYGRRYYGKGLHQEPSMSRYWRCSLPVAERFSREFWCVSTG